MKRKRVVLEEEKQEPYACDSRKITLSNGKEYDWDYIEDWLEMGIPLSNLPLESAERLRMSNMNKIQQYVSACEAHDQDKWTAWIQQGQQLFRDQETKARQLANLVPTGHIQDLLNVVCDVLDLRQQDKSPEEQVLALQPLLAEEKKWEPYSNLPFPSFENQHTHHDFPTTWGEFLALLRKGGVRSGYDVQAQVINLVAFLRNLLLQQRGGISSALARSWTREAVERHRAHC